MYVLDAPDIFRLIDKDPNPKRLPSYFADEMAMCLDGLDSLRGIHKLDILHGAVIAPHINGPWILRQRRFPGLIEVEDT